MSCWFPTLVLASIILMLVLIHIWETAMCLFGIFRPIRGFANKLDMKLLPMKGCKFWLLFCTYAIEHLSFFSMPHLLRHRTSVYNGLWGPVILTSIVELWQYTVTACFYDLGLSQLGFDHPTCHLRDEPSNRLCHHVNVSHFNVRCW